MKKRIILIGGFLISFCLILSIVLKNTYAVDTTNAISAGYSRSKMQDIVVSTALSYLYNNISSDYEQKTMGTNSIFNWRTFNQTPEMTGRSNKFFIDCSSFASSVIMYSLGYDFSDYYKLSGSKIFHNFKYVYPYQGEDSSIYEAAYKYYGKGISTGLFAKIGLLNISTLGEKGEVAEKNGKQYINLYNSKYENDYSNLKYNSSDKIVTSANNNITVYYYGVSGEEKDTRKTNIKDNIQNLLEPGDLVVYRRVKSDGEMTGHVMVYIGKEFDTEGGFVHATGSDYDFSSSPIDVGYDDYSIRYDNINKLLDNIFSTGSGTNSSRKGSSFTILRPINKYCNKDGCKIATCNNNDCGMGYLNNNVDARIDLKELRVEQYVKIEKEYNNNFNNEVSPQTLNKVFTKYNSINIGDNITYSLYLHNKSKMTYCTNGKYTTEEDCVNNKGYWRQKSTTGKAYKDLTITSKIPDNTEFVSCNYDCNYDNNTITWKISEENKLTGYRTYKYSVKVLSGNEIENKGMEIITDKGNKLKLSKMVTKVNPTINGINIDLMKKEVEKFKSLYGKNITHNSNSTTYKVELDNIGENKIEVSQKGFVQMIYYNTLGIDLGNITLSNIKNAIFNNGTINDVKYYSRKTNADIEKLTEEKYLNLNKMLVKGMYGGVLLKGNENRDRAQYLRTSSLEFGDILIHLYGTDATSISTYMFYGLDENGDSIFVRFESDTGVTFYNSKTSKTGFTLFKEIYSKDLFVVLRPTQLYGTTINYEYNGATTKGDNLYVAHDTYRNLNTPKKANNTINLVYNNNLVKEVETKFEITHNFDGWYSDKTLTNKVNDATKLLTNNNHKIYAKWSDKKIILPRIEDSEGKIIEGWYSDNNLKTKVANAGVEYTTDKDITLYAKWVNKIEITSDKLGVDNNNFILYNIDNNTTFNRIKDLINIKSTNIKFMDENRQLLSEDQIIKTGNIIKINDEVEYKLSVIGDIASDGEINVGDVSKLYQYIKRKINMDLAFQKAGDVTYDNEILINDVSKLYAYVREKLTSLK